MPCNLFLALVVAGSMLALQKLQYVLGEIVGLRQHGCTGLLQDLGATQVSGFRGEVRVLDA